MTFEDNFPFFARNSKIYYLDNAATSQVLYTVPKDVYEFETNHRANAHRSGHKLGTWVDQKYHEAKESIANWLNVQRNQIVFNSGTTQGLHDSAEFIRRRFDRTNIYIGVDSHHSLYLPFDQLHREHIEHTVNLINTDIHGYLDLEQLEENLNNDIYLT